MAWEACAEERGWECEEERRREESPEEERGPAKSWWGKRLQRVRLAAWPHGASSAITSATAIGSESAILSAATKKLSRGNHHCGGCQ